MSAELFPHTDAEDARSHFERYGHVGLTGLIDPSICEPAIRDAYRRAFRPRPIRVLGETITNLRPPSPKREPNLHGVLEAVKKGSVQLGRNIGPALRGEKPRVQLIDMRPGIQGESHHDDDALADIVAITNLTGSSHLWLEGAGQNEEATYCIGAGDIVYHDLGINLLHRGYTAPDESRVGLAIAKQS